MDGVRGWFAVGRCWGGGGWPIFGGGLGIGGLGLGGNVGRSVYENFDDILESFINNFQSIEYQ